MNNIDASTIENLHPSLQQRIVGSHQQPKKDSSLNTFILYLPTVTLRMEHNPAFCLASHLANARGVPLVVLAVVGYEERNRGLNLDAEVPDPCKLTARRLAFTLEGLKESAIAWRRHGAAVFIRVHGDSCRVMDHLTLSIKSELVVMDEPFVRPYLSFVEQVEKVCMRSNKSCYRVDGSTLVPPCSVLKKCWNSQTCEVTYSGVPDRAWKWEKTTNYKRRAHIEAAMNKYFDAPVIDYPIESIFDKYFNGDICDEEVGVNAAFPLLSILPPSWTDPTSACPGSRPWTCSEMNKISSLKAWSSKWCQSDIASPHPCSQTNGFASDGIARWKTWLERGGLRDYAKNRNDPMKPHSPSRMSCYLNLGIVSIFRLVNDIEKLKENNKAVQYGAEKFEEEILKWREFSYAHTFCRKDYIELSCLPQWAKQYLESNDVSDISVSPPFQNMIIAKTGNDKWDAMQDYLRRTGELHNNVRMTWGKTIVHWNKSSSECCVENSLSRLVYLNDRFALDGLSPPSYGGILWCFGWGDKPKQGIVSKKPASYYKIDVSAFLKAETTLYNGASNLLSSSKNIVDLFASKEIQEGIKRNKRNKTPSPSKSTPQGKNVSAKKRTLHEFFMSPKQAKID